jgi:hypothetical protein
MEPDSVEVIVLGFLIGVFIYTAILWIAMRITGVHGQFIHLLLASLISGFVGLIPFAGWLLSLAVLLGLICYWTDANLFPDAVLMVIVAWGIRMLVVFYVLGLIMHST